MRQINPDTYEPTGYRVFVRDLPIEERTKGGIILADTSIEADEFSQQFGVVLKKAPLAFTIETPNGRIDDPAAPNEGDIVNFSKYAGGQYKLDGEGNKYRVLNDEDIVAVAQRKEA